MTTESSTSARPTVVLGIDPGTRVLGYGAVVVGARGPRLYAAGVVRAGEGSVPVRLARLRAELDALLARLRPTTVVVESAFVARSVSSALRIGEGRGVALSCAAAAGADVLELPPAVAKRVLVGNGAADKSQVAELVAHLLGEQARGLPADATDALALALAHVNRSSLPAALRAKPARRRTRDGLPASIVARASRSTP